MSALIGARNKRISLVFSYAAQVLLLVSAVSKTTSAYTVVSLLRESAVHSAMPLGAAHFYFSACLRSECFTVLCLMQQLHSCICMRDCASTTMRTHRIPHMYISVTSLTHTANAVFKCTSMHSFSVSICSSPISKWSTVAHAKKSNSRSNLSARC